MNAPRVSSSRVVACATTLAISLSAGTLLACINIHATDLQGNQVTNSDGEDRFSRSLERIGNSERNLRNEKLALDRATAEPTLENRSDYAACLILVGKHEQAVELLRELEAESPGDYSVAANLGTAYELLGNNAEALNWIEQGMQRNPSSHRGSEWLHVEILKTKLRLAADPQTTSMVLNLDFGSAQVPVPPTADSLQQYDLASVEDLRDAIHYQLSERVKFVQPPEPIVAGLMFQLADSIALTSTVEEALPVYELAKQYGCTDPILGSRMQSMVSIRHENPMSGTRVTGPNPIRVLIVLLTVVAVLLAAVGGLLYWLYRWIQTT